MATSRPRGGRYVTSCPAISTRPRVGRSRPATIRSAVVFPHPDGPSRTTNCPSGTCRSSSSSTWTPSKSLPTPVRTISPMTLTDCRHSPRLLRRGSGPVMTSRPGGVAHDETRLLHVPGAHVPVLADRRDEMPRRDVAGGLGVRRARREPDQGVRGQLDVVVPRPAHVVRPPQAPPVQHVQLLDRR